MANINKDEKVVNELYKRITWLETEYAFLYDDFIQYLDFLNNGIKHMPDTMSTHILKANIDLKIAKLQSKLK